ncbi:MAG TPA: hypothetical protein VMK42_17245 [Anaeromyxobacteraceae bacterium]|nr:hypothetical protein [Anaeromyxobacteraceae bacterium]
MAKVGGEVDAFCSRCQLLLGHTVIAMVGAIPVKVECNTCRTVHKYRSAVAKPARPALPRGAGRAAISFDQMLASQAGPPRRYVVSDSFATGDVVDHPSFGRGFVSAQKDPGKVEVTFRTGVKTLVHGKR